MIKNNSARHCPDCRYMIFVREHDNEGNVECVDWKCKWNEKHPDNICKPVGEGYNVYPDQFILKNE